MQPEVVFEDEWILVVNKPSNLLIHHSKYARNIEEDSLTEILRKQYQIPVVPVHRLDRKTSGLILFAKNDIVIPDFQALFTLNRIQKTYEALLRGHTAEEIRIETPVKNDRGNYKDALTCLRTIRHYTLDIPVQPYAESRYSHVELHPATGRMHQLRIHSNKISHPIIGDPKYGNRHHNHMFQEKLGIDKLFLHAARLVFHHPITSELIHLKAGKPEFWGEFFTFAEVHKQCSKDY